MAPSFQKVPQVFLHICPILLLHTVIPECEIFYYSSCRKCLIILFSCRLYTCFARFPFSGPAFAQTEYLCHSRQFATAYNKQALNTFSSLLLRHEPRFQSFLIHSFHSFRNISKTGVKQIPHYASLRKIMPVLRQDQFVYSLHHL